jgi:alkanesulfonate monooxygenase SsuD/methylene tetrahydromethanopterin reductase-like flavin-dependent oxidoreductase (luciferase family)
LARIVALAVEAEAAGIELLAVPERLGIGGVPAALPVCAAAAASTRRLTIATAVLPLPLHHPLRVAEDVATLDGIANGRFELGVGLGADRGELAGFGLDAEDRGGRFEEAIGILRAAWQNGPIEFDGKHFQVDGIEVFPKPARPGGPPLWVGARAEMALRRAARLDLGVLIDVQTDVAPYLAECRSVGSSARIAITGSAESAPDRASELAASGEAALDLWIEVDPGDEAALAAAVPVAARLSA